MSSVIDNEQNAFLQLLPVDGLDIHKILEQLYRHLWIIISVALIAFLIGCLYALTIPARYQTTALIQINSKNSNNRLLDELGYKSNNDAMASTQIALMRTPYILEPVAEKNMLNLVIEPHFFPIFGAWLANQNYANGLAKPFMNLKSYAWGGEQIKIAHFMLNKNKEQSVKLIAEDNDKFRILDSNNKLLFEGKVGQKITNQHGSIEVDMLTARPRTEFFISKRSALPIAKSLARSLSITSVLGNDPVQNTGIFEVALVGSNPEQVTNALNAILYFTVMKNAQQKAQEIQKAMFFLDKKLPELKEKLEKAEYALNQYHIKSNSVSMSTLNQLLIQDYMSANLELRKLKSQEQMLLEQYTAEHPFVISVRSQEKNLQNQLMATKEQLKNLPFANQQEMNLEKDIKLKNALYTSLVTHRQQLEISKAAQIPDIAILTKAEPATSVPMHRLLIAINSFLMGAFFSAMAILIKGLLSKTVESVQQLEDTLNISVQSVIPFSQKQKKLEKAYQKGLAIVGEDSALPLVLAKQVPDDPSIEGLRSLRVSLNILMPVHQTIAIMGSNSSIGKSFISLNLAQVFAQAGKKTILIDADLRKGRLHNALLSTKREGLSEYLEGKIDQNQVIQSAYKNLYYITCGKHIHHSMELLNDHKFNDLLIDLKQEFDQIIIDTPPLLPVTDAILIAKYTDVNIFIVSAAKDKVAEVRQSLKKANTHGIVIHNFVMNYSKQLTKYGYGYGAYNYKYYSYGKAD